MNAAIKFENVSFCYEGSKTKILDNVDFTVNYGEITLLTGFSGSGKSTVMSIASGIIPNVISGNLEGTVIINNQNIKGKSLSEICRNIGIVLQNADSQIIQKTVEDEISFGCENFNISSDDIEKRIEKACLQMKLDKKASTQTLSGGQKQRLITAAVLAMEQKIIILDEPLANLDVKAAHKLMTLLKKLSDNGYAVLIIEHRIDMLIQYVDSCWSIDSGIIKHIKNKEELNSDVKTIDDISNIMKKDEYAFKLENVCFCINNKIILNDINLDIYKGERLLLLGENGCGKTTLLRLMAGLCKCKEGKIHQNIISSLRFNKKWFKKIGFIYQNPNYQLFMPTVKDEISFNAISEDYLYKMINLFNLGSFLEKHPHSLSEGQKRLVSIAAVMVSRPEVVFLDEPTVGQDFSALKIIIDALNQIHNETGNTMITITHDMRCAEALCDRTAIIYNGVIENTGGKELAHDYLFNKLFKEL